MKFSGVFKGRIVNNKTGEIICWEKHNKITKGGFDWIASLLSNNNDRGNALSYIGFGTGDAVTTYDMTVLQNEVGRYPATATWDQTSRELTFTGTLPQNSGITANIAEAGLFTASTGGVMFDRANFLPKGIDDSSSFTYTFVITISE